MTKSDMARLVIGEVDRSVHEWIGVAQKMRREILDSDDPLGTKVAQWVAIRDALFEVGVHVPPLRTDFWYRRA